jgi:hypothetical protein
MGKTVNREDVNSESERAAILVSSGFAHVRNIFCWYADPTS